MKEKSKNYKLYLDDCRKTLSIIKDNYVDCVLTDPPYFIEGLNDKWNNKDIQYKTKKSGIIGGLPVGMKFDRKQGELLQKFMEPIAIELFRILKPGGFCLAFSQARLYHRMAISFDLAGFEIRDMLAWKYEGQGKAFSQDHFIRKDSSLSKKEKKDLLKELTGYKTPQFKPQMEPIVLAQKLKEGTFVQNWQKYKVGLVNFKESLNGEFPGTVIDMSKHNRSFSKKEKIEHLTVKPVELIAYLIRLFTRKNQIILDPFMGSGTTGVAAISVGRRFIGIEKEERYFKIAFDRIKTIQIPLLS